MSGPIVRVGATQQFSKGWDEIFGKKKTAKNKQKAKVRASRKRAKKTTTV